MRETMTKFEFLGDLSRLIADLPEEDREQAMEYYEDYFTDAGPEKEQEIIKDFISPAYIAEQLREASAQRLAEEGNGSVVPPKTGEKPAVFSRKSAAQAVQAKKEAQTAPTTEQAKAVQPTSVTPIAVQQQAVQPTSATPIAAQQQAVQPTPATPIVAQQQAVQPTPATPIVAQQQAVQPTPAASVTEQQQPAQPTPAEQQKATPTTENKADKEKEAYESLAMRNPIFQQRSAEAAKKEEELLALKQKTKIDVKSINATTSKVDKKDRKAAKQRAAEEKAYNASLYSGPKKTMVTLLLIITSPITLCLAGVILALFALAISAVIGLVGLGVGSILCSILALVMSILALLTVNIGNAVFALGCALLLFSVGYGICFADYKIFTRVLPSAYYNILTLISSIKAKLARLAMK